MREIEFEPNDIWTKAIQMVCKLIIYFHVKLDGIEFVCMLLTFWCGCRYVDGGVGTRSHCPNDHKIIALHTWVVFRFMMPCG